MSEDEEEGEVANGSGGTPAGQTAFSGTHAGDGTDDDKQAGHASLHLCDEQSNDEETFEPLESSPVQLAGSPRRRGKGLNQRAKQRCRKCGNPYATKEWQNYHKFKVPDDAEWKGKPSARFLPNLTEDTKVWNVCTVPEDMYQPGFPCLDGSLPRRPRIRSRRKDQKTDDDNQAGHVSLYLEQTHDEEKVEQLAPAPAQPARRRGKGAEPRAKSRCRKCGHKFATIEWRDYHKQNVPDKIDWDGRPQSRVLRNVGEGNKVWDTCMVPVELYEPGFPCLEGDMPRAPRDHSKKKENESRPWPSVAAEAGRQARIELEMRIERERRLGSVSRPRPSLAGEAERQMKIDLERRVGLLESQLAALRSQGRPAGTAAPLHHAQAIPVKPEPVKREKPDVVYDPRSKKAAVMFKIVAIPQGKLGITIAYESNKGGVVAEMSPTSPLVGQLEVGDRIVTNDGRRVSDLGDLTNGRDEVRHFGIVPRAVGDVDIDLLFPQNAQKGEVKATDGKSASSSASDLGTPSQAGEDSRVIKQPDAQNHKRKLVDTSSEPAGEVGNNDRKRSKLSEQQLREKHQQQKQQDEEEAHHSDEWEYRREQLKRYQRDHGNSVLPPDYKAPNDMTFGHWVEEQRRLYDSGELDEERFEFLRRQGLVFDRESPSYAAPAGNGNFNRRLRELIEYRKEHGNGDVPISYPNGLTLGQWVHKQRDLYIAGKLDRNHHTLLEKKGGLVFEPGTNVKKTFICKFWLNNLEEVRQFKTDHGHLEIPVDYKPNSMGAYLDRWVSLQKTRFKKKELSQHQIRLLEEVGLDLKGRKTHNGKNAAAAWDNMFNEMLEFREIHGHCRVPSSEGKLGRWVRVQRKFHNKGILTKQRYKRLLEAGFDFDPQKKGRRSGAEEEAELPANTIPPKPPSSLVSDATVPDSVFTSDAWTKNYEATKSFIEENGHADVPPRHRGDHIEGDLHTWLETQKKFFEEGVLPPENSELLGLIGVDLNEKSKYLSSRIEAVWMNMFNHLKEFHAEHGHTDVPMDYKEPPNVDEWGGEKCLRSWLTRQREYFKKGKISEGRIEMLESLGVDLSLVLRQGPRSMKSKGDHEDFGERCNTESPKKESTALRSPKKKKTALVLDGGRVVRRRVMKKVMRRASEPKKKFSLGKMPDDNLFFGHPPEGIQLRIPLGWKFPMLSVGHMYTLWHCQHRWQSTDQNISPMKMFRSPDMVNDSRDRDRLTQVRRLCTKIDEECARKGVVIDDVMTPEEAKRCVRIGYHGLGIPDKTPKGRPRDVLSLQWQSAICEMKRRRPKEEKGVNDESDDLLV